MRWSVSACGSGSQNVRFYLSTTDTNLTTIQRSHHDC